MLSVSALCLASEEVSHDILDLAENKRHLGCVMCAGVEDGVVLRDKGNFMANVNVRWVNKGLVEVGLGLDSEFGIGGWADTENMEQHGLFRTGRACSFVKVYLECWHSIYALYGDSRHIMWTATINAIKRDKEMECSSQIL